MNARRRAKYASDRIVRRAAALAAELGLALELSADGAVKILGKLDSWPGGALPCGSAEDVHEAFEAWRRGDGPARR